MTVTSQSSVTRLIAGGKFRGHTERRTHYGAGRDYLDTFFIFKGALLLMISESPAWFDAKEWSAIGPQGQVRHAR